MGKNKKKKNDNHEKLRWVLREWDCRDLEEAKELAKNDPELHRVLRECGVIF